MHWLTRVGTLELPQCSLIQEHNVAAVLAQHEGVGGDVVGFVRRRIEPFRARGIVLSGALYQALRALVGTRQPVYRQDDEGRVTWIYAWVRRLAHERQAEDLALITVSLEFVPATGEERWRGQRRGAVWALDDGELLDSGLHLDDTAEAWALNSSVSGTENSIAIPNAGNVAVTNARWVITAGLVDVTQVVITTGIGSVSWSGTLDAGNSLVIDGDTWEFLNDGVNEFSQAGLPLGKAQLTEIAAGGETVKVKVWSVSAASSHTLRYEGDDAWA